MTDSDYESKLSWMSAELRALDLLAGDCRTWEARPSARTLLPRAGDGARDLLGIQPEWSSGQPMLNTSQYGGWLRKPVITLTCPPGALRISHTLPAPTDTESRSRWSPGMA